MSQAHEEMKRIEQYWSSGGTEIGALIGWLDWWKSDILTRQGRGEIIDFKAEARKMMISSGNKLGLLEGDQAGAGAIRTPVDASAVVDTQNSLPVSAGAEFEDVGFECHEEIVAQVATLRE